MSEIRSMIPEGISGNVRVEKFTVTEDAERFQRLRCAINPQRPARLVPAGTYTRLMIGHEIVMSDTPDEMNDHWEVIHRARGAVLINGLGLGLVLQAVLEKPEVEKVIVIEKNPDVIALVAPHFKKYGDRVEIIEADALEYRPPKGIRYGAVWHDIWSCICSDNLEDMKLLHRRYGKKADWQGSWGRHLLPQRCC